MLLAGQPLPPLDSGVGDLGVITGVLAPGALLRRPRLSMYVAFLTENGVSAPVSGLTSSHSEGHEPDGCVKLAAAGACAHDVVKNQMQEAADDGDDATELWKRSAVDVMISACELGSGGAAVVTALLDAGAPPEPVYRVDAAVNAKVGVAGLQPRKRRGGAGKRRVVLSPLHAASKHGNEGAIRELLKGGASLTLATAGSRAMAAHFAAAHSAAALSMLLDAGSPIRATDQNKQSLLHVAAREGNAESVSVLLQWLRAEQRVIQGKPEAALCMQRDRWNRTAVEWACVNGHAAVLEVLIEAGGPATAQGVKMSAQKHHKRTHGRLQPPLHLAVWRAVTNETDQTNGHVHGTTPTAPIGTESCATALACVELLLRAKADVNAADETGVTALHVVASASGETVGRTRCRNLLLEWGADPTTVDHEGNDASSQLVSVDTINDEDATA